jgi:hypothetical protein
LGSLDTNPNLDECDIPYNMRLFNPHVGLHVGIHVVSETGFISESLARINAISVDSEAQRILPSLFVWTRALVIAGTFHGFGLLKVAMKNRLCSTWQQRIHPSK